MGFEEISLLRIATDRRAPAWEAGLLLNYEHLLFEQTVNGEERLFLLFSIQGDGAPGRTRTCGILLRRQTLYPTELRAQPH
jgi:hypothetical protein